MRQFVPSDRGSGGVFVILVRGARPPDPGYRPRATAATTYQSPGEYSGESRPVARWLAAGGRWAGVDANGGGQDPTGSGEPSSGVSSRVSTRPGCVASHARITGSFATT